MREEKIWERTPSRSKQRKTKIKRGKWQVYITFIAVLYTVRVETLWVSAQLADSGDPLDAESHISVFSLYWLHSARCTSPTQSDQKDKLYCFSFSITQQPLLLLNDYVQHILCCCQENKVLHGMKTKTDEQQWGFFVDWTITKCCIS